MTPQERDLITALLTRLKQQGNQPKDAEADGLIRQGLAEQPDATLAELGARLDRRFRTSTIDLWLRRLGWQFKKNSGRRRTRATGRGRKKSALA